MRDRSKAFVVLRSEDGINVVALNGELDRHEGGQRLERTLQKLKAQPGARILLDFREVTYCCSSGIAQLLDASEHVARTGGVLVCAGVSGAAKDPMDLLNIPDIIPFYDTVLEALEALERGEVGEIGG